MAQRIEVVVGAQFGSEGKGHVTAQLVQSALDSIHEEAVPNATVINIRVAGPNAGHTVIDSQGQKFALRSVPVGAAISDDVVLYLAPGSELDLDVLGRELADLRAKGHPCTHIAVSGEATLLEEDHKAREAQEGLTERVGSTGKGIGAARADRLLRGARRVKDSPTALAVLDQWGVGVAEPHHLYSHDTISHGDENQHLIIEGTQGYGLGLHAGHYPQCTSSDCRAIDFLAMAGVSPWRTEVIDMRVWVVARAYPIRVAGNSGTLRGETTWEELGLPEEHTTVTQKVRRVGAWDADLLRAAVQANGGHSRVKIAVTMADQRIPEIAGFDGSATSVAQIGQEHVEALTEWLVEISTDAGAQVGAVTTSPNTIAWTYMDALDEVDEALISLLETLADFNDQTEEKN